MNRGKLIHDKKLKSKDENLVSDFLSIAKCLPGLIRPFYGWLLPWLHCCCTVLYRKCRACSETCFESIKQFFWKPDSVACCNLADFCSCLLDRNQEAWVAKRSLRKGVDSFTWIALVHAIFFIFFYATLSVFFTFFGRDRVCWPLLCLCCSFCIFERCLVSNPDSCHSKQAHYYSN